MSAGLAFCAGSFSSQAATANVLVGSGGNFFAPTVTNISAGDRVLWTWVGSPHNVTSTNSAWAASATLSTGATFTNTFTTAGNYFYYCTIHGTPTSGMKAEIVVAAVNVPPTVAITNPAPGTVYAVPASVTMRASASDSDGAVTNVQFLVDANILMNEASGPFTAVTNNLAAGSHTLSAIASDNSGARTTNTISISVVTPVAVLLSTEQRLPPGKFRFTYSANSGLNYKVESSTNLFTDWTPLVTNMATGSSVNYTDVNATSPSGFYRVGRLPNP